MKVGLCGLGDRLSYLADTFSALIPEFELVAYADPTPAKLGWLCKRGHKLQGYLKLADMLRAEGLDLLMIGSPNNLHFEHIQVGLRAGVRVFTEKPVVVDEAQTFQLMSILKEYGSDQVLVGLVLRYAPLYKDLKRSVEAGHLGNVVSMEASEHIAPEHGALFMRDWRRHSAMSGGFLLEKCCHDIDLYQSIAGSRPQKVVSFGGRKTFTAANRELETLPVYHKRKARWGFSNKVFNDDTDLVDYQTALIEYENGVNLCFHANLNVPDEYRHFTVVGTRGTAEGDFVRGYYRVHDAPTSCKILSRTYSFDHNNPSVHYGAEKEMAADLAAHFHQGLPLPVSIFDALQAGLTAMKLDESRYCGRVVDLAETWQRFDGYGIAPHDDQ